jgi:succinate dehydrogenase / fumarate reductase membrane anchor subunit
MVNATKKWIFLKISSVILIPLMLWFIINFVSIYDKNFDEILFFLTKESSKFLLSVLMIVAFFFSALSISEIFEDYVHDKKIKKIFIKLLYLFAIIIPFFTIIVILNLNI